MMLSTIMYLICNLLWRVHNLVPPRLLSISLNLNFILLGGLSWAWQESKGLFVF